MSRRFVFGFGRIKPLDVMVFIGVNVLVGLYIWKPYLTEMQKKKLENPDSNQNNKN